MNSDTDKARPKGHAERWQILPDPPRIDYFVALHHDEANLTIVLRPVEFDGRFFKITFANALCCRTAQEGLSFNSVELIDETLRGSTFFVVSDSAFLRQFHENSSHAFDDWNITHFAIFASNFIVDVLSIEEPLVTWLENPSVKDHEVLNDY